ncbi:amidohydrolase [Paraburkholderia sediminicola]|uniref:amidohydrolase n=1 Tax=Paraburkholderia sediminicola TaxID=458836 RepID=UPI0038B9CCC9
MSAFIGARTQRIDIGRRLMLPGFVESHWHFSTTAFAFQAFVNFEDPQKVLDALRKYVTGHPHEKAISGMGWVQATMPAHWLRKETLDAICPDRPVCLLSTDFHTMWTNSRALEIAGIDRDTPVVEEGASWFEKDAVSGEPTGLIVDGAAYSLLMRRLSDAGYFPQGIDLYLQSFSVWQEKLAAATDPVATLLDYRARYRSPLVKAQVLKLFVDGTEMNHTAYLLAPYADQPHTCGDTAMPEEDFRRLLLEADRHGIDVMMHCVGDAAVRLALDGLEQVNATNPPRERRHVITHAFLTHPDDIPRFRRLGVLANTQLQWGVVDAYSELIREYYGEERWSNMYKFRTFIDQGVTVSIGMDGLACQCRCQHRPVEHIESGHTRQLAGEADAPVLPDRNERLSIPQLIAAYTINGAYQLRMEHEIGSLTSGKRADLIVLESDLFEVAPHDIGRINVALTMMNGAVTHGSPQALAVPRPC